MTRALSRPRLYKLWVQLERLVCVFKTLGRLNQLDKCGASVAVKGCVCRVSSQAFVKLLYGAREISILEQLDTGIFVRFCNLWIDVRFGFHFFFRLFKSLHRVFDCRVVVFQESDRICVECLL